MSRREERNVRSLEQKRALFYKKNGYSVRGLENRKQEGQNMKQEVTKRYRDVKLQERRDKIRKSK